MVASFLAFMSICGNAAFKVKWNWVTGSWNDREDAISLLPLVMEKFALALSVNAVQMLVKVLWFLINLRQIN